MRVFVRKTLLVIHGWNVTYRLIRSGIFLRWHVYEWSMAVLSVTVYPCEARSLLSPLLMSSCSPLTTPDITCDSNPHNIRKCWIRIFQSCTSINFYQFYSLSFALTLLLLLLLLLLLSKEQLQSSYGGRHRRTPKRGAALFRSASFVPHLFHPQLIILLVFLQTAIGTQACAVKLLCFVKRRSAKFWPCLRFLSHHSVFVRWLFNKRKTKLIASY
jgi:hypothetical protein